MRIGEGYYQYGRSLRLPAFAPTLPHTYEVFYCFSINRNKLIIMRRITLTRLESSDHGTFGTIQVPNDEWLHFFFTGELPWRENRSNLSCIPTGVYKVDRVDWLKHNRKVYMVLNVKGRGGILIHAANFMGDKVKGLKTQLLGCVALGERLGTMDGQKALLLSSPAIRRFEALLDGKPFELEIK